MNITSLEELEDVLSQPTPADVEAMRGLSGDLLILGVAGKMGPTLARRARRACDAAGVSRRIIGVSRFSGELSREALERSGVETVSGDLLAPGVLDALPDAPNIIYMAARKFGSTGDEAYTWAMNTYLPARVAERFARSRIVAFSTGNVYPLTPVAKGGPTEDSPVGPVGEYAMSTLGRERMFTYFSRQNGTPTVLLRLNYAVELRYGVLVDIGRKVLERRSVDLAMGHVNVIWQGDANSVALRSLAHAQSPPLVLNLTGPQTLAVRWIAQQFAQRLGVTPQFGGVEAPTALLSNAALCAHLFGRPSVPVEQMIDWTADWIARGGASLGKPTHFETRDGRF